MIFVVTDLGTLSYFLGIEVTCVPNSIILSQSKYIRDLLHKTNMVKAKSVATPVETTRKLSISEDQKGLLFQIVMPQNTGVW